MSITLDSFEGVECEGKKEIKGEGKCVTEWEAIMSWFIDQGINKGDPADIIDNYSNSQKMKVLRKNSSFVLPDSPILKRRKICSNPEVSSP